MDRKQARKTVDATLDTLHNTPARHPADEGVAVARPAVYIAQCELDSLREFANTKKKAHGLVWSEPTGQAGIPLYTAPQND